MHLNRKKINQPKLKIKSRSKKKQLKPKFSKKDIKPIPKIGKKKKSKIKVRTVYVENDARAEKNFYKPLSKWENCLNGHTAFILGNGPSISSQKLKLLDNYFTIGINRIFYIYNPVILLWQDRELWNSEKRRLTKQSSIKICNRSFNTKKLFLDFKLKMGAYKFLRKTDVLCGTGNTGALAAQLAVALGCSNIVLLGTDCKYKDGKTDFYGKNKDHKPYTLKMCKGAMEWLKKECPVPIYNCSDNNLWKKQDLSKVINHLNPPKSGLKYCKELFLK